MPEAVKNYSITELEMCGVAINIASFAYLLKRVDFNVIVDHLAIMHTMKCKMEPATNRIKKLLEVFSAYSFNLYYIKGKDMVLSDFLSSQQGDDSDPHQCYVRQCSLLSYIVRDVFKCLGLNMHFISLYGALSLHNCLSSGSSSLCTLRWYK